MTARAAMPTDLPRVAKFLSDAAAVPEAIVGSVLPRALSAGAFSGWLKLLPGTFGMRTRVRVYIEEYRGRLCSVSLVYAGRRPEWVVLALAALPDPSGSEGSFRLLSHIAGAAAQRGMLRVFGAVSDEARPRETFFQAGFYSYTRETWYAAPRGPLAAPSGRHPGHPARRADAHDLFRFYVATTPHAVQRAEQLTVEDFDIGRRAGAFDPPHLVSGNPLTMRRATAMIAGEGSGHRPQGFAASFRGLDRHPNVLKVRTANGDTELARELVRGASRDLDPDRPVTSSVRSYEEHVARALVGEGFREVATAMLFVRELAVRIEEPALAPAVVR